MSDKNCNIIKDLLPLYIDGVASEETGKFVENHIAGCKECAKELELLKEDIPTKERIDENMEEIKPIIKIKKQIRKKQVFIAGISALAVAAVILCGFRMFLIKSRPDINGNDKIISKELTNEGIPKDVIFDAGNGFEISKATGAVYLSLPVNNKKMTQCRVTLTYDSQEIEDKTVAVSEAGYVTYAFEDLQDREDGLYLFAFYDTNQEINQYVTAILTP